MSAVGIVQVTVDQIVYVITVRHTVVTTIVTMQVCSIVAATIVTGGAASLVGTTNRQRVLVYMGIVHMVQVIVM